MLAHDAADATAHAYQKTKEAVSQTTDAFKQAAKDIASSIAETYNDVKNSETVHVIEEKVGDFAVGVKDVVVAAGTKLGEAINTVAEKVAEVLFPEPIREDIEKEVLDADLAKILAEKKLGSANIKLEDRPLVSTLPPFDSPRPDLLSLDQDDLHKGLLSEEKKPLEISDVKKEKLDEFKLESGYQPDMKLDNLKFASGDVANPQNKSFKNSDIISEEKSDYKLESEYQLHIRLEDVMIADTSNVKSKDK